MYLRKEINKAIQVGQLYGTDAEPNPSGGRVYSAYALMRTLGGGHGMSQPLVLVKVKNDKDKTGN